MSVQESPSGTDNVALSTFWDEFRVFPQKWLEFLRSRPVYLLALTSLPYVALLAAAFTARSLRAGDPGSSLLGFPELHVLFVGMIAVIGSFMRWQARIPKTFQWIMDTHRVRPGNGSLRQEYQQYLCEYQQALLSKRTHCALAGALPGLVMLFFLATGEPQGIIRARYWRYDPQFVAEFSIVFLGILLWGYLLGSGAQPLFVTGRTVKKLAQAFEVNIQPSHPDKCGGLKPLGDFCFSMALPVVSGGLALATIGVGGSLSHLIGGIRSGNALFYPASIYSANVLLIVLGAPLAAIAFLVPLWDIHRNMVERKKEAEDGFANRVARLEREIRTYIDQEGELDKAKIAKEKLEIVQVLHPARVGYPVWPFRLGVLVKLFSPQILSIVTGVVSVYEFLSTVAVAGAGK